MTKPWHTLDSGVTAAFLERQWELARSFADRGYCAGTHEREGTCVSCGACDSDERRRAIGAQPEPAVVTVTEFRAGIVRARGEECLIRFKVNVLPKAAGLPRKVVGVALSRALMLADERLVEGYRGYRGSYLSKTWSSDWMVGDDWLTLAWNGSCEERLREMLDRERVRSGLNAAMMGYGTVAGMVDGTPEKPPAFLFESLHPFEPEGYFKSYGIRHTLVKTGDGAYRFDLSRESLKKKIIAGLSVRGTLGVWTVTAAPGPKFQVEEFMRTAFRLPAPEEWVRIAVRSMSKE